MKIRIYSRPSDWVVEIPEGEFDGVESQETVEKIITAWVDKEVEEYSWSWEYED